MERNKKYAEIQALVAVTETATHSEQSFLMLVSLPRFYNSQRLPQKPGKKPNLSLCFMNGKPVTWLVLESGLQALSS